MGENRVNQLTHILTATVLALGRLATAADLYVSPEGNDAWTGKLEKPNASRTDGPLASLVGARDAIRKIKASGALRQPIRVFIRSGQYAIVEPLIFGPEDSGTEQCPITYLGDSGKRPILGGGKQITGWKKQGDRWIAHIPDVEAGKWSFAALWVDGERRVRADAQRGQLLLYGRKSPADRRREDRQSVFQRPDRLPFQAGRHQATEQSR